MAVERIRREDLFSTLRENRFPPNDHEVKMLDYFMNKHMCNKSSSGICAEHFVSSCVKTQFLSSAAAGTRFVSVVRNIDIFLYVHDIQLRA